MGGKRIADQVRRALIVAAKVAPVAAVIDASGCDIEPEQEYPCAAVCPRDFPCPPDAWGYGGGGYSPSKSRGTGGVRSTGGRANAGAPIGGGGMTGIGGRDSGKDARDASADATALDASLDASKDGG
jgi:hypothetical protein